LGIAADKNPATTIKTVDLFRVLCFPRGAGVKFLAARGGAERLWTAGKGRNAQQDEIGQISTNVDRWHKRPLFIKKQ